MVFRAIFGASDLHNLGIFRVNSGLFFWVFLGYRLYISGEHLELTALKSDNEMLHWIQSYLTKTLNYRILLRPPMTPIWHLWQEAWLWQTLHNSFDKQTILLLFKLITGLFSASKNFLNAKTVKSLVDESWLAYIHIIKNKNLTIM